MQLFDSTLVLRYRMNEQLLILRLCYVGEPFLSAPLYNKYYKKVKKKNLKTFICCTFKVLQFVEIMFLVI